MAHGEVSPAERLNFHAATAHFMTLQEEVGYSWQLQSLQASPRTYSLSLCNKTLHKKSEYYKYEMLFVNKA